MRSRTGVIACCGLLVALAIGCSDASGPPAPPALPASSADVSVQGRWIPAPAFVVDRLPQWDSRDALITFGSDGSWHASDGCNDLFGSYDVVGSDWSSTTPGFTGGVGCPYGMLNYTEILGNDDGLTLERSADRLTFVNREGKTVLRLSAYHGHPAPYHDVNFADLAGAWRPIEIFGKRVRGRFSYGFLGIGEHGASTVRGCRWYRGSINLGLGGGVFIKLRDEPIGCPVDVGPRDLGPDTERVLRQAVRLQTKGDRLVISAPRRHRIGIYVRTKQS